MTHPQEQIIAALQGLLAHPMPYDLIRIRETVKKEYGGDESAARAEMECYCTEKFLEQEMGNHRTAKARAKEILEQHSHANGTPQ